MEIIFNTCLVDVRHMVTLSNGGDNEAIFPMSSVERLGVDWTKGGGCITFHMNRGSSVSVTFDGGDHGEECADVISDLFKAWNNA